MVSTVGKKLQQAREKMRVSLEEASRITKIRPDRISDLEHDDFTQFPNLTYAKGFLLIYAKYLGVDVSEFASTFENTSQINVSNYEYLNNASNFADASPHYHAPSRSSSIRSQKPLLTFIVLAVVIFFGWMFISFLNATAKRLKPSPAAATPAATPTPAVPPLVSESDRHALQAATPVPTPRPVVEPAATALPTPFPAGTETRFAGEPEIRRAQPVKPDEVPAPTPPPPARTKEIVLQSLRKTWVQIQRDDEHSVPVFEDWIYPDARPLKVRGLKFWIKLRDPAAVKISRDGQPVAVTEDKVVID